jgi:hypothetical protein
MCGCECIRGRTARSAALWSRISARRWAVALDAGGLVFVDSDQLVAE